MLKKIIFLMTTSLLFTSCLYWALRKAERGYESNDYYYAIKQINEYMEKKTDNIELLEQYEKNFNAGEEYYPKVKNAEKELYLMEELYLNLPSKSKEALRNIKFDMNKHKILGKEIANNMLNESEKYNGNNYRDKVRKYNYLKNISNYDNEIGLKIEKEKYYLFNKIEKTYSLNINSNNKNLSTILENKIADRKTKNFKYKQSNADMRLELDLKLDLKPIKKESQSVEKEYTENYKTLKIFDSTNLVKYKEIENIKTREAILKVNYRLISNLTEEVISSAEIDIPKKYEDVWYTYEFLTKVEVKEKKPESQKEPKKTEEENILTDLSTEIIDRINKKISDLPSYEDEEKNYRNITHIISHPQI